MTRPSLLHPLARLPKCIPSSPSCTRSFTTSLSLRAQPQETILISPSSPPEMNTKNRITTTARFHNIHHETGTLLSREIDIRLGAAHEAWVYVRPDVGEAIRAAVVRQMGLPLMHALDPTRLALEFHHGGGWFGYRDLPLPRLEIPRGLPGQMWTVGDVSPATLWMSGVWHAITLDGSFADGYERRRRNGSLAGEYLERESRGKA